MKCSGQFDISSTKVKHGKRVLGQLMQALLVAFMLEGRKLRGIGEL
jgi:hypothetical protein